MAVSSVSALRSLPTVVGDNNGMCVSLSMHLRPFAASALAAGQELRSRPPPKGVLALHGPASADPRPIDRREGGALTERVYLDLLMATGKPSACATGPPMLGGGVTAGMLVLLAVAGRSEVVASQVKLGATLLGVFSAGRRSMSLSIPRCP